MFSLDLLLNALVAGVLLGGFYAAVSLGIGVTFGLLVVVNIAHPVFVILGCLHPLALFLIWRAVRGAKSAVPALAVAT